MNKVIKIIVAPNGQSHVETKGFIGSECRQASRFVELALGQQTQEQLTSEFHQQIAQEAHQQQQHGKGLP